MIDRLVDTVAALVGREIKGRYKNTVAGMAWAILNPLMFMIVFYFLFKIVLDVGGHRYASATFTGILAWTWFQTSLNAAANSISGNGALVGQPGFPVAALPVVPVVV